MPSNGVNVAITLICLRTPSIVVAVENILAVMDVIHIGQVVYAITTVRSYYVIMDIGSPFLYVNCFPF